MSDIVKFIDKVLPMNIGSNIQYSESQNIFMTNGYTSNAGNTYFKGLRLSDRIFIVLDIGIGYAYTFINGITVYANKNDERIMVASRSYHNQCYSETIIKEDAKEIVLEKLKAEAETDGTIFIENEIVEFVDKLVEDTYNNQIETIKNIQLNNLLTQ